jgi:alanine dehydrogenase
LIDLNETEVRENLPWPELVEAIRTALLDSRYRSPARTRFDLGDEANSDTGTLLVMPGWHGDDVIGLKVVTVWTGNHKRNLPSHVANYMLMSARSGKMIALLSGEELTLRRTAAVSALGARELMRTDATRLLLIGTGPVAFNLALCHAKINQFQKIEIYGRDAHRASRLVAELKRSGVCCSVSSHLETSVREAHVISTATSACEPLFPGDWVKPGTHLDLVGSFKPEMREVDDRLMQRAASIWVDTLSAVRESGDLIRPLEAGVITPRNIAGDLQRLVSRETPGHREADADITVFKAVGFSTPDLAAAQLVARRRALGS